MSLADLNSKFGKKDSKKTQKHGPIRASARVKEEPPVTVELKKVPKVLRSLLDAITEDDIELVVRVWREAMVATRSFWRETGKTPGGKSIGAWQTEPDHKTRLEASKLFAAYKEGLPIQRQVHLQGSFEDLGAMMEKLGQSSAAQEAMKSLGAEVPAIEMEASVQETPSESGGDSPS